MHLGFVIFTGVTNFRDLCQHSTKQIENVANSLNEALGAYLIINQGHVTIVAYCRCQIIVFPIRRPFFNRKLSFHKSRDQLGLSYFDSI